MASHQSSFFAYLEHASIYSNTGHKIVFSVSETAANLRKIGSENHHLQLVTIPVVIKCGSITTSLVGKTSLMNTLNGGKDAYSLFEQSNEVTGSDDFPLKFLGAACTSLDGTNPCTVIGVAGNNMWDKVMYMVNTKSKFTYNPDTNDDGVADYPTSASGTVALTNGGAQWIMIVSTAKTSTGTQSFARAGGNMMFSKRIFRIDRPVGATSPQSLANTITTIL